MKSVFTLMIATLFATISQAQQWSSTFNLRLQNNAKFIAWLDGRQVSQPTNRIVVENLRPGKHHLKIAVVSHQYGVKYTNLVFNSFMKIAPNRTVSATINHLGDLIIEKSFAMNQTQHPNCTDDSYHSWHHPHDNTYNYHPSNYPSYNTEPAPPVSCNLPGNYQPVADAVTFQQLKDAITNASFESTKLSVLKQASTYYFFTTNQVRELVSLFSFESTKLDVAKMLYDKTTDKQNYFNISQAFSYSSSTDALAQYVAQR